MIEKMKLFSSDDSYIEYCIRNGIDLYNRVGNTFNFHIVELDELKVPCINVIKERFPMFIRNVPK